MRAADVNAFKARLKRDEMYTLRQRLRASETCLKPENERTALQRGTSPELSYSGRGETWHMAACLGNAYVVKMIDFWFRRQGVGSQTTNNNTVNTVNMVLHKDSPLHIYM